LIENLGDCSSQRDPLAFFEPPKALVSVGHGATRQVEEPSMT
jgi:hypothetical protein